jgi:hypothetical protein
VTLVNQKAALALGALAGAAAAVLFGRKSARIPDKVAPPTIIAEEPSRREPPPANEFEAMRRRVHEEGRAAAEEMRRRAETDT